MKDCTDITLILDRSGSMWSVRESMEEVLNGFIAQQKIVPGACVVTLVQFDDRYEKVFEAVPLTNVGSINLVPRGSTALFDAISRTVDETGTRFAKMPDNERPNKVVIAVITDGKENSSTNFSQKDTFDKVSHQRDCYKWEFIFLGADQDAIASAKEVGINVKSALNFSNTKEDLKGSVARMSEATKSYRTIGCSYSETLTCGGMHANVTKEDETNYDTLMAEVRKVEEEKKSKSPSK